jgi:hypothetical protein
MMSVFMVLENVDETRLHELDKEEFRAATRVLWPADWTDETFDDAWDEFQKMKALRAAN